MISNAKTPAAAKRLQGVPTCCNGGFVTKLTCSAPTTSYPQHPGWFALLYSFWLAQMQGSPAPGLAVLSMHQPWASLLVYGLKRIEGRAWPTDYNGRLWIHATSTKPTAQDIEVLPKPWTRQHLRCSTGTMLMHQALHTSAGNAGFLQTAS